MKVHKVRPVPRALTLSCLDRRVRPESMVSLVHKVRPVWTVSLARMVRMAQTARCPVHKGYRVRLARKAFRVPLVRKVSRD